MVGATALTLVDSVPPVLEVDQVSGASSTSPVTPVPKLFEVGRAGIAVKWEAEVSTRIELRVTAHRCLEKTPVGFDVFLPACSRASICRHFVPELTIDSASGVTVASLSYLKTNSFSFARLEPGGSIVVPIMACS